MVASFGTESPVLDYGPRAHADPGRRNDRVWLLWPAWAFRVIAPEFRHRGVNALQRATLGVLRASRFTAAELGERLGVHPELAAFVVAELQNQGRIDDGWAVTESGTELLDAERDDSASLAPGWVFKDPWEDRIWPFVAPSQECARTERDERGRVVLELGTTGKPWRQQVWMQLPPTGRNHPPAPDPRQILRAARQHRRLERRQDIGASTNEEDMEVVRVGGLDFNRVTSIEAEPEPVFLVSFLYVPRDGDDADWHACEFFGRGSDPTLRRLVVRVAEDGTGLAQRLDRLLGPTPAHNFADFRRAEHERSRLARRLLERALTIDISHRKDVADVLVEVIESWLELSDLGDAAGRRHQRNVLTSCRIALERLFLEVGKDWPLTGVADQLPSKDREMAAETIRASAAAVGLDEPPDALCNVKHGQVRAVSDFNDGWRLRPLVVATILRARTAMDHPLRSAAGKVPDLLARVERIVVAGGEAAHGTEGTESVAMVVQETAKVAGLLLNLPMQSIKEFSRDGEKDE